MRFCTFEIQKAKNSTNDDLCLRSVDQGDAQEDYFLDVSSDAFIEFDSKTINHPGHFTRAGIILLFTYPDLAFSRRITFNQRYFYVQLH